MMDLTDTLKKIGLLYSSEHLDDLVDSATQKRFGAHQLLEYLCELELRDRTRRSLERRMQHSKLGRFKTMADFDWKWPDKIDREAVQNALSLGFLSQQRNLILVASQGLGKTMIAKNIIYNAVMKGHSALFTTASDMLLNLSSQESSRMLDRRLKYYARMPCLCVDEIGYSSYDSRNADLLFQLVAMRYESKSLLITTNLSFKQWPTIFPGAACTTALIDRVVHHADIITIEGESYRLREAQNSKKKKTLKSEDSVSKSPS